MKLPSISLALGMFLLPFTGNAQCGIIVVGDFDQTIVAGNEHTPFATNTGSNNRRGFRAQYLYRAEELTAAGLCPGLITKIRQNVALWLSCSSVGNFSTFIYRI